MYQTRNSKVLYVLKLPSHFLTFKILISFFFLVSVSTYPVMRPTDGVVYLHRFGYIPESELLLRTVDLNSARIKEGIRKFQYFAGISTTGTIDNETLALMNAPRCGNQEKVTAGYSVSRLRSYNQRRMRQKRYILDSKWEKIFLTYKILNYPSFGSISKDVVDKQVKMAFEYWMNETNIHIVKSTAPGHADIEISFVAGSHDDGVEFGELEGVGKVVAHAWKPFNRQPLRGDIHFNDEVPWTTGPVQEDDGFDFLRTIVHEAGHSLGLEHSPSKESIMYFAIKSYDKDLQLSRDDKEGIQQLYGAKRGSGTFIASNLHDGPETKPLTVPSGIPNRRVPWPCYILQEDDPDDLEAIRNCYQQFYKEYYYNLQIG